MHRLSRQTTPVGALFGASSGEAAGIVHLGLGNFHRAHAAVYTAHALAADPGDWGIHGFANRSRDVVSAMSAQDGRYSVLEFSDTGRRAGVVDVHRGLGVLADEPEAFISAVAARAHRILTLTVSEVGYCRSARNGTLDLDLDDVRADIANPAHPRSTIGLIARGLAVRATHGAPITVLSCDNLQSNGDVTRSVLTEFLHASAASDDVLNFVANHVTFPNSMVDRIVPATTAATIADVGELIGVDDRCPVPAEDFTMWVLEDDFAAGRPAWDRVGAVMSDEVEAYELVKLRLLNGSHSLIAYLGILDGRATIADAWAQDFVRDAVRTCIATDYLPTIALPHGFDVDAYLDSLSHRWANAALGHRTSQVGTDGSVKLLQRIPEPALMALRDGRVPHLLALTVAGWIATVAPPSGFDPGLYAAEVREPARDRLSQATLGASGVREHAMAVLHNGFLPDDLTAHAAFTDRVADLVTTIVHGGIRAAAREAAQAVNYNREVS
jgi:fructuronate reductase